MHQDVLDMAMESGNNVVVSISGRRMFFPLELLESMKGRGIDTTADNLFIYCHKMGEEVEGAEDAAIRLVSKDLSKDQAMAV